ncbi:isoaspartyl peptidase/L-asparaginase family protein [uncultured Parasphingopyxis sp.]|uniref:isoaspartyl peptidase/L-asparaginase family protein n=1 Tax=uncultured Parasphingopyxis sp. TaxID=1547918 RepID=UPI00260E0CF9|nr:isoaspartyl peptidase/L-asparaginase [uncultured Parasphingopyxis sp.]
MRLLLILAALFLTMPAAAQDAPEWTLVIHGGAGTIERDRITPEQDSAIRAALTQALETGSAILDEGGSALDAVEATLRVLEDDPHFNAGRGAVFTWQGTIEHDASIMDGATRDAGAVTGTSNTRHPITLARRVMDSSPHVFLSGEGADQFSREQGLEQAENSWFETGYRRGQWEEFRQRTEAGEELGALDVEFKYGTVGAVAMDREGHMAAATSTGGMTGKRWGRIGDSPVIGAGTYADDRACAVSATGDGEYFIRAGVAQEICTRIRYRFREAIEEAQASVPVDEEGVPTYVVHASEFDLPDEDIQQIADEVIADQESLGGTGGVIVTTPWGNRIYSFDTPGMYRGMAAEGEEPSVAIYGDE